MASFDIPVLVIFGPTACGKTAVAQNLFSTNSAIYPSHLCKYIGKVEVISADSMQVYTHLSIGTAKPDKSLRESLPHHVIDIISPDVQFGTGDFVSYADAACADIFSRGNFPVLIGGTAFYIHNFMYGLPDTPATDESIRKELIQQLSVEGIESMYLQLQSLDPVSARRIHKNDAYRILRALEVFQISGKPVSSYQRNEKTRQGYTFCLLSLCRPREILSERITSRVHDMFEQGLENEFESLRAQGYTKNDPGMQAIGYREFFERDKDPTLTREDIARLIIRNTKKYAKRQETWMRSMKSVHHVDADDIESIFSIIDNFFTTNSPD